MSISYRTVRIHPDDLERFNKVKGEFSIQKMRTLLKLHDNITPKITGKWTLDVKKYKKMREDDLPRMRH